MKTKIVIDTCSLLSLVRYYLPFDEKSKLHSLLKDKIEKKEIIILDAVADECRNVAKGIVVDKLDFLKKKENHFKTVDLLPDRKFFELLETAFKNSSGKIKNLNQSELEQEKDRFLRSADAKLLLFALAQKKASNIITLVTEESESNNDNKVYKKIPSIGKLLELQVATLPQVIPTYARLDIQLH